jgi:hypothetical protein
MSSPPVTNKKAIRELTNNLLIKKTLNSLVNNNSQPSAPAPPPSTLPIKENIPIDTKSLNLRLSAALKPTDNVAALLNFYQTLTNHNLPSNSQNNLSSVVETSSSFVKNNLKEKISIKR